MKHSLIAALLSLAAAPAFGQSTINPALPEQGLPYSSTPIRNNFQAAADDINALYGGKFLTTAALTTGVTGSVARGQLLYITSATTGAKSIAADACNVANDGYFIGVVDEVGTAETYNITITPTAGTVNNTSSYVLNANSEGVLLRCHGATANWENVSNSFIPPMAAAMGGTGVNNGSNTITVGGNLVTNGAVTVAPLSTTNGLLYSPSAGNISPLATANNGVLVTNGGGVPAISSTLPSALTIPSPTISALNLNGGNVGIGSSSPVAQLYVHGIGGQTTAALTDSGSTADTLFLNDASNTLGSGGAILFGGSDAKRFAAIKGLLSNGTINTIGDLAFSTRNAMGDTALTERMRITASGRLGIGTAAPNFALDTVGDTNTSGIYRVGGSQIAAANLANGTTGSGAIVLATGASLTAPVISAINNTPIGATTPSTIAGTTLAIASGVLFGTGVLSVGADASAGYTPGSALGMVTAIGAQNGFIGQVRNNVAYATNPFLPVGTTGYGQVPNGTASAAFGLYGLGEIYNTLGMTVGGEVTARNFSGVAADTGVPPPTGSPSTKLIADGFQVTCGSKGVGERDCSTGLYISNESGGSSATDPSFANGLVINAYRIYGLYILPGYSTGTQTSAEFDNNGNGINLILKTTGTTTPSNAVLVIENSSGVTQGGLFQNGDGHFNNVQSASETVNGATFKGTGSVSITNTFYSSAAVPLQASGVTTGTPVASACWDTNGNLIKKTTTGSCI